MICKEVNDLERLSIEDVPVELQDHFTTLDAVNYEKFEKDVQNSKQNQFMTVVVKPKIKMPVTNIAD